MYAFNEAQSPPLLFSLSRLELMAFFELLEKKTQEGDNKPITKITINSRFRHNLKKELQILTQIKGKEIHCNGFNTYE